ncbi:RNA polymerase subunit sigma [Rhizobium sp. Root73]|uniref:RNA polymerase sigma factor n=1 Tax=unclassified Rhizobium TaxID=2613769 RepID=UPI000728F0CC|nr:MULTISPECIES: RNA polymerase sigma factor [unclassified Rhizobium]KQY16827.1 RNA polymerase subunit sigma [Rhizobium sp. Root1334]KRC11383.1 RNA polymerase subunit sigma [Rhizobium sp. Root73]
MTPAFAARERSTADDGTSEALLAERTIAGDSMAFRMIMARYNQRLFRIARGFVRDDSVAEDVVQEAYVNAFQHLGSFRADASLSTWLHRIVMNEALGRLRKASRSPEIAFPIIRQSAEVVQFPSRADSDDPEKSMAQRQILRLVEEATDELPGNFRLAFIARVIEGMSVEETAELLGIKPDTVRSRLHRARALLRKHIDNRIGPVLLDAFPFAGWRCERLTAKVVKRLGMEE